MKGFYVGWCVDGKGELRIVTKPAELGEPREGQKMHGSLIRDLQHIEAASPQEAAQKYVSGRLAVEPG